MTISRRLWRDEIKAAKTVGIGLGSAAFFSTFPVQLLSKEGRELNRIHGSSGISAHGVEIQPTDIQILAIRIG